MGAPIVHIEFKSTDFERTTAFYGKLFDWRTEKNASSSYMKLDSANDGPSAGWIRADLVQSPGPIAYLTVEDLEGKLDEVERAGGRILARSLPFAGGGEVGLFADPDGNVVGLWRRKGGMPGDAKAGDAKAGDAKAGDAKTGDAKAGDAKTGDAKAGDAKAGDAKAGDAKAGDAKTGDAKGAVKSAAPNKAAPKPLAKPKKKK